MNVYLATGVAMIVSILQEVIIVLVHLDFT